MAVTNNKRTKDDFFTFFSVAINIKIVDRYALIQKKYRLGETVFFH